MNCAHCTFQSWTIPSRFAILSVGALNYRPIKGRLCAQVLRVERLCCIRTILKFIAMNSGNVGWHVEMSVVRTISGNLIQREKVTQFFLCEEIPAIYV